MVEWETWLLPGAEAQRSPSFARMDKPEAYPTGHDEESTSCGGPERRHIGDGRRPARAHLTWTQLEGSMRKMPTTKKPDNMVRGRDPENV